MAARRVAFKPGFLVGDLGDLPAVKLGGSRCRDCGIAFLGERRRCENCTSPALDDEVYSDRGTVWSWTVQRYPPPPPFDAPRPWSARPVAWIDLDGNGPRVLGPVLHEPDAMSVGLPVLLHCSVGWRDGDTEVVSYAFVGGP